MIWVSPKVMAAPIGSAVVLKAGIVGSKKQLLPGQKLEWTIAEGSPGIIESAGGGTPIPFVGCFPNMETRLLNPMLIPPQRTRRSRPSRYRGIR